MVTLLKCDIFLHIEYQTWISKLLSWLLNMLILLCCTYLLYVFRISAFNEHCYRLLRKKLKGYFQFLSLYFSQFTLIPLHSHLELQFDVCYWTGTLEGIFHSHLHTVLDRIGLCIVRQGKLVTGELMQHMHIGNLNICYNQAVPTKILQSYSWYQKIMLD